MAEASSRFAGMTVNERLWTAGLFDRWDAACRARDRAAMIEILGEVEIAEPGRAPIADSVLADPAKYGF
jgi:hypothetical protein